MNWRQEPALYVMCSACNPRGAVLKSVKYTSLDPKLLKKAPETTVACMYCGARLTFDSAKVPTGGYCLDAELASPDGSGAAWIAPKGNAPSNLKRFDAPQPPAPAEEKPPSVTDELESQVEQLRELRDYVARRRPEFADDPILLDAFDRLVARKKRTIMGTASD